MKPVKGQWMLIREVGKFVGLAVAYGVIFGAALGVSALFLLHFVYGFSLIPCQFDFSACQVPSTELALPIPYRNYVNTGDDLSVALPYPGAFRSRVKMPRSGESQHGERSESFRSFGLRDAAASQPLLRASLKPSLLQVV